MEFKIYQMLESTICLNQTICLSNVLFSTVHFMLLDVWGRELGCTCFLVFRIFKSWRSVL